jgi:uncharacterized lipoprotein NlpE involved in copper resistance
MVMKKLILYLMVVLFGLSLFSCKKDEKTAKENLIGKWMMTAMTISPAINGVTDMFSTTDACGKDDLTIFNADGTVTNDEGVVKCNASDPQTSSGGTWVLSADGKTLTMTSTNGTQVITIVTLTSTSFVGKMTMVESGVTYTYTVTLVKK